ncbi:MAG: GNAT family N-acetyltransferase [Chloroflexota bacterium]
MTKIHTGYLPGTIGRVAELHGRYYAAHWHFGVFFEARVAKELSDFMMRYDAERDCFWAIMQSGRLEGSLTIDGIHAADKGAHLRWFIMSDALRGQGFGNRLIQEAITFCRHKQYPRIYLHTFAGLNAARRLYEKAGFTLIHEEAGQQWGTEVTEQTFVLEL